MYAAWTEKTIVGSMTLVERDGALVCARFGAEAPEGAQTSETPLIAQAFRELEEYFEGKRRAFTVALAPGGTVFQRRCWEALEAIPYGETRTYAQQAAAAGNPRACRAAGLANNRNPLPIFIPRHRVVGKNGALVGYGGGLGIKEKLLNLENNRKGKVL